jgi:hypothetical protein
MLRSTGTRNFAVTRTPDQQRTAPQALSAAQHLGARLVVFAEIRVRRLFLYPSR